MQYIWLFIVTVILSGCGSIPEADPELISNFKPHTLNDGDDVGIYLVRPNQFAGGGRDYWVATDDKVIGDLENNTYVFMSLNSKKNMSINTVVSMASQNYIGIPDYTGSKEYYFYSVDFNTWIPKKLSNGVGKTLVSKLSEHKLDHKQRPNDGYDNLAMNPGLVENYMSRNTARLEPDNEHGVIYIFRPSSTNKVMSLPVSVWTERKHLGTLDSKQLFKVKIPVGKTQFYRKDGEFHHLEINVEPNKYHYIELDESFSFTGYNHSLNSLGSEGSLTNKKVMKWMDTLVEYAPVPEEKWTERQKSHVVRGMRYLKKHKELFIEKNE